MRQPVVALCTGFAVALAVLAAAPATAIAQTDEIQVYDGGLADVGKFNLTWHNNFTPEGREDAGVSGRDTSPTSRSTASPSGRTA